MRKRVAMWLAVCICLGCCTLSFAQSAAPSQVAQPTTASGAQQSNLEEYAELLRVNLRQQKAEIMGAMMQLDVDQSAKFWPIYSQYNAELTKLNDQRVANIEDYARNYANLTDAKADELVQKAFAYRQRRAALVAKYYRRVKAPLGALQAGRFFQIEDQLLAVMDLQIASSLPIGGQGE